MKSYIPTINISALIKNNFNTKKANQTIKQIEKALSMLVFSDHRSRYQLKEIKKTCNVGNKFLILLKLISKNYPPKNGIKKIKIFIEDTFQMT